MKKYLINPNQKLSKIKRDVYGHFSEHLGRCIYEGLFVGKDSEIPNVNGMRKDVVEALKEIRIPVLRWPGGCFADEYHWKDGIGPNEGRKKMINTHWGGVTEDNSFGTHEFFELCSQLGCAPYINGNVGSGTVQEMCDWVEYMTFDGESELSNLRRQNGREEPWKIKYFGVGNENWGCGGHMLPEDYTAEYRRYETYIRDYHRENHIIRIACGPNADDYHWTETLMKKACSRIEMLSLHYYCGPMNSEGDKGYATGFDVADYYGTLKRAAKIEEILTRHEHVMNQYDPEKRVALAVDEWGAWYKVEPGTNPGFLYQQNTMRDAIIAAMTLNIFNKHSDRVRMANIAQTVNVLQSVALTDGERMLLTPTYYVFKLFREHQDSTLVGSYITNEDIGTDDYKVPKLYESASLNDNDEIIVTIANASESEGEEVRLQIADWIIESVSADILAGEMGDFNSFEDAAKVKSEPFLGFIKDSQDSLIVNMPPCSVVRLIIK